LIPSHWLILLYTMREADSGHVTKVNELVMTELPYLSTARISGPDATTFLHAQLSADIAILEPGDATFACYCSPAGKVFGMLLVCRIDDDFMVVAASELLTSMVQRLRLFVLRARVELAPQPEIKVFGVDGGGSDRVTKPTVFRSPVVPKLGYVLSNAGQDIGGNPDGWKELELRGNIVWLGPETTEKFIPQMLGYDKVGAVSFSKGCYPGQEIVARTKYLGKVKRKPLLVKVERLAGLTPGTRLRLLRQGEWSDGTVVDHAVSDKVHAVIFIVASVLPEVAVEQLEYEDQIYPCATM
jgi:folate-binding protein YgfZ